MTTASCRTNSLSRLAAAVLVRALQDAQSTGEHAGPAAAWLASDDAYAIGAALGVDVRSWPATVARGIVKRAAQHYTPAERQRRHAAKTRRTMDPVLQTALYQDINGLVRQYETDAARQIANIMAQLAARPRLLELAARFEQEIPALERQIADDEQALARLADELREATRRYDEAQTKHKAAENRGQSEYLAELALNETRKAKIVAEAQHRETETRLKKSRTHLQRAQRMAAELRELPEPDRAFLAGLFGSGGGHEDATGVSGTPGHGQRHRK